MCVISMVYDTFTPRIDRWQIPIHPTVPIHPWPVPGGEPPPTISDLERLLKDFRKAAEAAKVVDALTGQPDCADPEKAKLEARVADLEREVKRLRRKPKRKKKRLAARRP